MSTRTMKWAATLCFAGFLALMAGCDKPASNNNQNTQGGNTNAGGGNTTPTKQGSTPTTNPSTRPAGGADTAGGGAAVKPRIAYITNGVDPFWTIAEKGAMDAAKKFNADVQVIMPDGANDQKQKLEDLLTKGIDGVAISPIDAKNQTPQINDAAKKTKVITHDSDAPDSDRLLYIGVDNYKAGRMVGQLVKDACPSGGKVAIFVGRLEQDNAHLRRQGVIDELLDRQEDSTRFDPPDKVVEGKKFTIVGTLTDQFDRAKAKGNMEDMITKYPDLACAVGLFAYNPPACLEGIKQLNKLGQVKVAAFDEQDTTLQAIKDGNCQGTVVQNPYMYGHESVRILAGMIRGQTRGMPTGKFMDVPARKITKENVDEFWADLRAKTAK